MKSMEAAVKKILMKEGGAAGFDALEDGLKKMGHDVSDLKGKLEAMGGVSQHEHKDYILEEGLGMKKSLVSVHDAKLEKGMPERGERAARSKMASAKRGMMMMGDDEGGPKGDDKYSDDPHMAMKEMAKELYKASKLHAGQADKLIEICEEMYGKESDEDKSEDSDDDSKDSDDKPHKSYGVVCQTL